MRIAWSQCMHCDMSIDKVRTYSPAHLPYSRRLGNANSPHVRFSINPDYMLTSPHVQVPASFVLVTSRYMMTFNV